MLTGAEVRTALGLRSTWFSVGVLALDPLPATTLKYGTSFTLTGLGRGRCPICVSSSGRRGRPSGW